LLRGDQGETLWPSGWRSASNFSIGLPGAHELFAISIMKASAGACSNLTDNNVWGWKARTWFAYDTIHVDDKNLQK
jgi:hypothetical protein